MKWLLAVLCCASSLLASEDPKEPVMCYTSRELIPILEFLKDHRRMTRDPHLGKAEKELKKAIRALQKKEKDAHEGDPSIRDS